MLTCNLCVALKPQKLTVQTVLFPAFSFGLGGRQAFGFFPASGPFLCVVSAFAVSHSWNKAEMGSAESGKEEVEVLGC
jgi:hypothetical protein